MSPSSEWVIRQRHKRYWYYGAQSAHITAGLTAYWNPTGQAGSETFIPEVVGGRGRPLSQRGALPASSAGATREIAGVPAMA